MLRTLLPRISAVRIAGEIEPGIFLRPGGPTSLMVEFEQKPLARTPIRLSMASNAWEPTRTPPPEKKP